MDEYDIGQDLTQEIKLLKFNIDTLSKKVEENFSTLNKNLSISFEQISKQIVNLSNQLALDNEIVNTNIVNNNSVSLSVSQKQTKIPDKFLIDYSYIDITQYPYWVENLKKYSKAMAECRHQKNISNFCKSANDILESAIEILFKEEYRCLSEKNKTFLEAYEQSKKTRIEKGWEFIEIYVKNNIKIESEDYKKLNDKYISWKDIEKIRKKDFNHSLDIFFEILKPNFIKTQHLREKYFVIKGVHSLRNLTSHGTSRNINSELKELNSIAQNFRANARYF